MCSFHLLFYSIRPLWTVYVFIARWDNTQGPSEERKSSKHKATCSQTSLRSPSSPVLKARSLARDYKLCERQRRRHSITIIIFPSKQRRHWSVASMHLQLCGLFSQVLPQGDALHSSHHLAEIKNKEPHVWDLTGGLSYALRRGPHDPLFSSANHWPALIAVTPRYASAKK